MDQTEIITFRSSLTRDACVDKPSYLVSLFPFSLMEEEVFVEIYYETVPNLIILNLVLLSYLVIRVT